MAPDNVVQWIIKHYPKPRINPAWLDDRCTQISEANHLDPVTNHREFIQEVEKQILESSLHDSMVPGTGLPNNVSTMNDKRIDGSGILVEVTSITDIAHSAFSLQNTRQTRIDRADLAGLAPEDEEDEGPVPKYPRGVLRFQLSDGAKTLDAIEYQSLPELELGVTPLGYKMIIKNVLVRRGIAFLEPRTVVLKGHSTAELEARQDALFTRSLRVRLGQDVPEQPHIPPPIVVPGAPVPAPETSIRFPLREPSDLSESGPSGTYHHHHDQSHRRKVPISPSAAPSESSTLVRSSYFSTQYGTPSPSRTRPRSLSRLENTFSPLRAVSVDVETEENDEGPAIARSRAYSDASSDYESMEMDDAFLAEADLLEKRALEALPLNTAATLTVYRSQSSNTQGNRNDEIRSGSGTVSQVVTDAPFDNNEDHNNPILIAVFPDVITIDDDEDDKENVPVPTRHVRQRTRSPLPPLDVDVIEISD